MWTTHLKFSAPIFIFSILATACAKKDDHSDADWIYVNQSKYKILIQLDREPYMDEILKENFTLNPGTKHVLEIRNDLGFPNMQVPDFRSPYQGQGATITVNNKVFKITSPNGIAHTINYQSRKLGDNYFQFTYTFTNEYIEKLLEQKQEQTL